MSKMKYNSNRGGVVQGTSEVMARAAFLIDLGPFCASKPMVVAHGTSFWRDYGRKITRVKESSEKRGYARKRWCVERVSNSSSVFAFAIPGGWPGINGRGRFWADSNPMGSLPR
jgi:hypothetical protein